MMKESISSRNEMLGQQANRMRGDVLGILALLMLVVIMFADVLFTANPQVLSFEACDLASALIYWREFGFEQLKHGNLPMWNPHVFCGIPFLGGFEAALLYLPNFVYLILPLANAVNVGIALHVFLAGLFTYLWARYRGLHPLACWLAGVLLILCGPHFMHIYAGHLSNLCAMPWVPLVFLSIDGIYTRRTLGWALLGMVAVAMLILAGHPQYVFYTAVASLVYCVLCMHKQERRGRVIMLLVSMGIGAAMMVAPQLLTGLQESAYTVRGGSVPYQFAAMFSFPPENLLTLLAPNLLGSLSDHSYWGRCFLWEMSLFFGVTGLVLAIYGAVCGAKPHRRFCIAMIVLLFVLALGAHTPLFRFLYETVPGFNKLRGNSKFTFQMMVFAVMLAGVGLHRLIESGGASWRWVIGVGTGAAVVALAAGIVGASAPEITMAGWWHDFMRAVHDGGAQFGELYRPISHYDDVTFVGAAAERASNGLWVAAGCLTLATGLLVLWRWSAYAAYAVVALALAELVLFARPLRPTFDLRVSQFAEVKEMIDAKPGDYRIMNMTCGNSAMHTGAMDIWGADAGVLRRYAEFMTFTQGQNPDEATENVTFTRVHPLYPMLRLRYILTVHHNQLEVFEQPKLPLPRFMFMRRFQVLEDRDAIFHAMSLPSFNVRQKVILEAPPNPPPMPGVAEATARIIDESTDHLTIEADVAEAAILLITDAYHPNWCIEALPGSSQQAYEIMPANYVLRAVPLSAGKHRFRMEYKPLVFGIGMWLSVVSLVVYLGLCVGLIHSRRNKV